MQYRYILLFPLAVVEGPIIAVIAGFLCSAGIFNVFIVYPLIVAGDVAGDSLGYALGRLGVPLWFKKMGYRLGISKNHVQKVRLYFWQNAVKTIVLSKITLGIGVVGIYLAGNARLRYSRFLGICALASMGQFIVYLAVGALFGSAYQKIGHALDLFGGTLMVLFLSCCIVYIIKLSVKKI